MKDSPEVTINEAEQIWNRKCPVCGGNLLGSVDKSGSKTYVKVICEFGCKRFKVPARPELPMRI